MRERSRRTFSASCLLSALIRDSASKGKSVYARTTLGEQGVCMVFFCPHMSQPIHRGRQPTRYIQRTTGNAMATPDFVSPTDTFIHRHIGPTDAEAHDMLATLGLQSLEELSTATVPADIRMQKELDLPLHRGEQAVLEEIRSIASENQVYRSLIGMGYYDCLTPGCDSAQYFRKPVLVHPVHPLPG